MPQFRDEAGNIWEVDAQGNQRFVGREGGPAPITLGRPDPYKANQDARANAEAARAAEKADRDRRDYLANTYPDGRPRPTPAQMADARKNGFDFGPNGELIPAKEPIGENDLAAARADAKAKLEALDRMEALSNSWFGTGFGAPTAAKFGGTNAATIAEMAQGIGAEGALQKVMKMSKENGGKNPLTPLSEGDFTNISKSVANLSVAQSDEEFRRQVNIYRDIFKRAYQATGGKLDQNGKPSDDKTPAIGSNVSGGGSGGPGGLAGGGDSTKSIPVPRAMQQEYEAYVKSRLGNLNPQEYAQFRAALDAKYNFPGRQDAVYAEEAKLLNTAAQNPGAYNINLTIPPATAAMSGADKFKASVFNNWGGAALLGATSLGGGMDEVAGAIRTATMGGDYETNRDTIDGFRQASADAFPKATFGGNIGGAALAGYGLGQVAPNLAARVAQIASTLPGAAGLGGAYGGATGALESNNDRLTGAGIGALAGATGGAVGNKVIAPIADSVASSRLGQTVGRFVNRGGYTAPPTLSATEDAIRKNASDLANVQRMLSEGRSMGLPIALADTDPKLRMMAGATTRKSPDARAFAETVLEPRSAGQAERALGAIDQYLAPRVDIEQRGKQLLNAGRTASEPYYQMAKNAAAPVDPELAAMLRTSAGQDALTRARKIASDEMVDPDGKRIFFDNEGLLTVEKTPTMQTLDLVKRGFDSRLNEARNPITGQLDLTGDPVLGAIEGLRKRFVSKLDTLNENYPKARAEYAKYAQAKETLERGRDLQGIQVLPRQTQAALGNVLPDNFPELQRGYATAMGDTVSKTRFSGNPYEAIYGSPAQRDKIGMVFPQGANRFGRQYDLEREMTKTGREVLGGSPTAARLQADEAFGPSFGENAVNAGLDYATTGGVGNMMTLGRTALQALRDANKLGVGRRAEQRAAQMAPALLDPNNAAAAEGYISDLLAKALKLDQRAAQYRKGGGLFGAASGAAVAPLLTM